MNNSYKKSFKMSTVPDEDKYIWYLCVEQTPLQWTCDETTAEKALKGRVGSTKNTMVVPVSNTIPKILDNLVLSYTLRNQIKVQIQR